MNMASRLIKTVDNFAQREIAFLFSIGGIELQCGKRLGEDFSLDDLRRDYDGVFLGMGLAGVNKLKLDGEEFGNVLDAVDYISDLRQANDTSEIAVGRHVVVIGGGMTAIDVAVQTKLLGAEDVTIVYRRGKQQMNASTYEQHLAQTRGVKIKHWAQPVRILGDAEGKACAMEFAYTDLSDGKLVATSEHFTVQTDMIFKAIGQSFLANALNGSSDSVKLASGRIEVNQEGRTSLQDVWAGGDCIAGGEDLTVAAVDDGRNAAESMHRFLTKK